MLRPGMTREFDVRPTSWLAVGVVVVSEMLASTPLTDTTAAWASSMPAPHVEVVQ